MTETPPELSNYLTLQEDFARAVDNRSIYVLQQIEHAAQLATILDVQDPHAEAERILDCLAAAKVILLRTEQLAYRMDLVNSEMSGHLGLY